MPLLLLFIVLPLLEIWVLLKVGAVIGAGATILLVIATAIAGTLLLKQQGFAILGEYQKALMQGRIPAGELVEGAALVFGGALLLTPGFITDSIGFLCLLPFTRRPLIRALVRRFGQYVTQRSGAAMQPQGRVYDDPGKKPTDHDNSP